MQAIRVKRPQVYRSPSRRVGQGERPSSSVRSWYRAGQRDFRDADLIGANFRRARLCGVDFRGADLSDADLNGADLTGANLTEAKLTGANLRGAILADAIFHRVDLTRADLIGADLCDASFCQAELGEVRCDSIYLASTLVDTDIGPICKAQLRHAGPSNIDWRTVARSLHCPRLREFLRAAGMPPAIIDSTINYAHSLGQDKIVSTMRSTFISYGGPDERFARRLHEELQKNGVTTFFFPEHAAPGERLHRVMRRGINDHDRVILICSKQSLNRPGVLNEIEETLAREAFDGGASCLIPIRLDRYVFSGWTPANPDLAQAVLNRVVADFEGTDKDQGKFNAQLRTLLKALQKRPAL